MGRIPRFKEKLPDKEDFIAVQQRLIGLVSQNPDLCGAIMYGSVPRGEATQRSDLDCLVLYDSFGGLIKLRRFKQVVKREHHVDVDFATFHYDLAKTPFTRADISYLDHVTANPEEKVIIGENPIEIFAGNQYLRSNYTSMQIVCAGNIGYLIDGQARRFVELGEIEVDKKERLDFLSKVIEKTYHMVRESVRILSNGQPVEGGNVMDRTSELCDYYFRAFSCHPELVDVVQKVSCMDRELTEMFSRDYTFEEYDCALQIIEAAFPAVHRFGVENAKKLMEYIK